MILIMEKAAQRGNATQPKEKHNQIKNTTSRESCQQRLHRQLLVDEMYRLGFVLARELIQEDKLADYRLKTLQDMMLDHLSRGAAFFHGVANALRELIYTRRLAQCE